eukprot:scaffold1159_cov215-Pinguiococcus_pyrenoidosus.AAC.1
MGRGAPALLRDWVNHGDVFDAGPLARAAGTGGSSLAKDSLVEGVGGGGEGAVDAVCQRSAAHGARGCRDHWGRARGPMLRRRAGYLRLLRPRRRGPLPSRRRGA